MSKYGTILSKSTSSRSSLNVMAVMFSGFVCKYMRLLCQIMTRECTQIIINRMDYLCPAWSPVYFFCTSQIQFQYAFAYDTASRKARCYCLRPFADPKSYHIFQIQSLRNPIVISNIADCNSVHQMRHIIGYPFPLFRGTRTSPIENEAGKLLVSRRVPLCQECRANIL